MPVVESLICKEADGKLSFGNYILGTKSKVEDFGHDGDVYKVKTYKEITKAPLFGSQFELLKGGVLCLISVFCEILPTTCAISSLTDIANH